MGKAPWGQGVTTLANEQDQANKIIGAGLCTANTTDKCAVLLIILLVEMNEIIFDKIWLRTFWTTESYLIFRQTVCVCVCVCVSVCQKTNYSVSQYTWHHVTANISTNDNVFFFVSDLKIVYYNNY